MRKQLVIGNEGVILVIGIEGVIPYIGTPRNFVRIATQNRWQHQRGHNALSVVKLAVTAGLAAAALLSTPIAAAAPATDRGVPNIDPNEPNGKSTGKPTDPNGFGAITSQRATLVGDIGAHVSTQPRPHLGVGNVARHDNEMAVASGSVNTGTRPGDHAEAIYKFLKDPRIDPELPPGRPR